MSSVAGAATSARRLLWTLPTLLLVAAARVRADAPDPGRPGAADAGRRGDPEQLGELRAQTGPRPAGPGAVRALAGAGGAGDLGQSIAQQPAGAAAAARALPGERVDRARRGRCSPRCSRCRPGCSPPGSRTARSTSRSSAAATLLLSIPSFWLGLLLLLFFGLKLGWLPVVGYVPFAEDFGARRSATWCCRSSRSP